MSVKKRQFSLTRKIDIPIDGSVYLVGDVKAKQVTFDSESYDISQGGFEAYLCKGVVFSGGSVVPANNTNDTDPQENTMIIYAGSTVTDEGQVIRLRGNSPGTTAVSRTRTNTQISQRWLLSANKAYAIKLTNTSADAMVVYAELYFTEYELV